MFRPQAKYAGESVGIEMRGRLKDDLNALKVTSTTYAVIVLITFCPSRLSTLNVPGVTLHLQESIRKPSWIFSARYELKMKLFFVKVFFYVTAFVDAP